MLLFHPVVLFSKKKCQSRYTVHILMLFPSCWRQYVATAGTTKRPTCCVFVLTKPAKWGARRRRTDYDQVMSAVAEVTSAMF